MRKLVAAAFVVACSSLPALADPIVPTSVISSATNGNGADPFITGPVQSIQMKDDGLYNGSDNGPWVNGDVGTYVLGIPTVWGLDSLLVQLTPAGTPTSLGVWRVDGFYTDINGNTALFDEAANIVFLDSTGSVNLVESGFVQGVGFDRTQLVSLTLTFTVQNAPVPPYFDSVTFERISNPEPGAIALFGLGALGLGGVAWKRRKLRKAAAKA